MSSTRPANTLSEVVSGVGVALLSSLPLRDRVQDPIEDAWGDFGAFASGTGTLFAPDDSAMEMVG